MKKQLDINLSLSWKYKGKTDSDSLLREFTTKYWNDALLKKWQMVILFSQLSSSLTVSPGWASSSSSAVCPGEAAKVFLVLFFLIYVCLFVAHCKRTSGVWNAFEINLQISFIFYLTKNSCCKKLIDRPNQLFYIWIFIRWVGGGDPYGRAKLSFSGSSIG